MLDLGRLDLDEIATALADQTDYEHRWLINPHTPVWYAFRDSRAKRRAVEWLAENSLIDDASAGYFLTDHPDPELP